MTADAVRDFPDTFVWGAATAAYQIEGAVAEDGRQPSIWDTFSHTPGKILGGDTGDIADDHYHRVDGDVALLAQLGLHSYRFSIAWPRIVPSGAGTANQRGLDFYSRLVDTLLEAGIAPFVTLYHWDLPQPLQELGGWAARDTSYRFAEYAAIVARTLGDRVSTYSTLNEPWCSAYLGYSSGAHAPGITDHAQALAAVHHLNLAHGLGTSALRATLPGPASISITLNLANVRAASDAPADQAAAELAEVLSNQVFLQPILQGRYPAGVIEQTAESTDWSFVLDGDLELIRQPIELLGVNYYTPARVCASTAELRADYAARSLARTLGPHDPTPYPGTDRVFTAPQAGPYTDIHWRIEAESLTELLLAVHEQYPELPLAITENGAAFSDAPGTDGQVHDERRTSYLRGHLSAILDAIAAGVDVRGYYLWSLLDNFEWAYGYSQRFGIVYVDYATQERTIKDSGYWYARTVAANQLAP